MTALLSRLPLKLTAPLVLSIPVAVVALALSWIAARQAISTADELASQNLTQIHERIGVMLEDFVAKPDRVAQLNRDLIADGLLDPTRLRLWSAQLYYQSHAFPEVSGIGFGSSVGDSVAITRYPGTAAYTFTIRDSETAGRLHSFAVAADGDVPLVADSIYDFDARGRPWYLAAERAGATVWAEPYAWVGRDGATAGLGLPRVTPIYDGERLLGVVYAELSLYDLSEFLRSLSIGKTGMTFVADASGRLLASSVGTDLADESTETFAASRSEDPRIRAVSAHVDEVFGGWGSVDRSISRLRLDGVRHVLRVAPFVHSTGLHWEIATLVPEDDFFESVRAGRNRSMAVAAAAIAATLLLGVLVAFAMVSPIVRLAEHVRAIGDGDLDAEVELGGARELVDLSRHINAMSSGLREHMALRQALDLAMEVQQGLLPDQTPQLEGLDIAGHSDYCDETGGDYYDFLHITGLSPRIAAIAIGDVSGHGVAAAMLMATARGILRSRCEAAGSLADLLAHLNKLLVEVSGGGRFMTMLLFTVDAQHGCVRWSSAGHGPPFVFDPAAGGLRAVDGGGVPLGILDDQVYDEYVIEGVSPGQVLLAATDGVWETQDAEKAMFGMERVESVLSRHAHESAEEIRAALVAELDRFRKDARQNDDITFVVVKLG